MRYFHFRRSLKIENEHNSMKTCMQKFDQKSFIHGTIGTQERVLVRQGKRAIRFRAIDILLYFPIRMPYGQKNKLIKEIRRKLKMNHLYNSSKRTGLGCLKLTTSFVNVSLKIQMLISHNANIFCRKNLRSFCTAKASLIFSTKISLYLVIKS